MIKLIIAGGRDFNDFQLMDQEFLKNFGDLNNDGIIIISGEAQGADSLGEDIAYKYGLGVDPNPALWSDLSVPGAVIRKNKYGHFYNVVAGYQRNERMAEKATHLLAFFDGKSKGTADMLRVAKNHGLSIIRINYG